MNGKKSFLVTPILLVLLILFTVSAQSARANKPNKLVFATIAQVQQMISDALVPVNASINVLSNRATNLETTISQVPSQVASLQNKQTQTDTRLASIESFITPLPGQVGQLQQQNTNLLTQIAGLTEKVGTLEAQVAQLKQDVSPTEVTFFPFGNIQVGQISQSVGVEGYKIITLTGEWEFGTGGFHIYFSDDQTNWTEQAQMSQNSNFPPRQITIPVKGKYYRADFTGGSPFTGSLKGLIY